MAGARRKIHGAPAMAKTTKPSDPPQVRVEPMVPIPSSKELRSDLATRSILSIYRILKKKNTVRGVWFLFGFSITFVGSNATSVPDFGSCPV